MPSKKKKYNARFPPARIKKIMQTDEEVGKVAAAVPVIISRALELFIDSLIEKTASVTRAKNAKTLSSSHVKQAIHSEKTFDFLRELVKNVPDHQTEEEVDTSATSSSSAPEKKPKVQRPKKPKEEGARGRGRPRKVKIEEKKNSASEASDEETETDEEVTADEDSQPSQSASQNKFTPQVQGSQIQMMPGGQSGQMLPQGSSDMLHTGQGSSQMLYQGQSSNQMLHQGLINAAVGTQGTYSSALLSEGQYSGENSSQGMSLIHNQQQNSMISKPQTQTSPVPSVTMTGSEGQVQQLPGIPNKQEKITHLPYPVHSQSQHRMPQGFPPSTNISMHNMVYPQYQFMPGGQPMPYIHPQSAVGAMPQNTTLGTNPVPQSTGSVPPQFIPSHPAYMMPQMVQNGPVQTVGPAGMPGMPVGPPPPLVPISTLKKIQDGDGDANVPLDMSLTGKSRSQTSTVPNPPPSLTQIPTPRGPLPGQGFMQSAHEIPPVPYSQNFQEWRVKSEIKQNVQETGCRSQILGPPPLVSSTVTQSSVPVTENGKHKQNEDSVGIVAKKSKQKITSEDPGEEKSVSFPGLANIMNMKPVKSDHCDDADDYDT